MAVHAQVYCPDHPNASASGMVYEHVLVAERALGRYLPGGVEVHHVNGDERDNRNRNLVICQDKAYHKFLHVRARVVAAGGDPDTQRICARCHQLKSFSDFNRAKSDVNTGLQRICRECSREYFKEWSQR